MDRKFVLTGLIYAVIGILMGIFMAATHNHAQLVTHAHILLAGFVVSFIYGLCHKLWINNQVTTLSKLQFYFHQVGVALLSSGLFLLYGNHVTLEVIDPLLAISSFIFLTGMIMMVILFLKSGKEVTA